MKRFLIVLGVLFLVLTQSVYAKEVKKSTKASTKKSECCKHDGCCEKGTCCTKVVVYYRDGTTKTTYYDLKGNKGGCCGTGQCCVLKKDVVKTAKPAVKKEAPVVQKKKPAEKKAVKKLTQSKTKPKPVVKSVDRQVGKEVKNDLYIPSMVPIVKRISSDYGKKGQGKKSGYHVGIDIAAPLGTPVQAAASGYVVFAGMTKNSGYMIEIKHEKGYSTRYACLSEKILVDYTEKVKRGQYIGHVGTSCKGGDPHLHYGVYLNGHHVDPAKFIPVEDWKKMGGK